MNSPLGRCGFVIIFISMINSGCSICPTMKALDKNVKTESITSDEYAGCIAGYFPAHLNDKEHTQEWYDQLYCPPSYQGRFKH